MRADWTVYALGAGIITSMARIVISVVEVRQYSGLAATIPLKEADKTDKAMLLESAIILGSLAVWLTTMVLFLMWFHRVCSNLKPLGARRLQHTARLAVAVWFIPFAHLFIPHRIAKEVWIKSDTSRETNDFLYKGSSVPGFINAWWGCWVASCLIGYGSSQLSAKASIVADRRLADWFSVISEALSIAAAILAIRVIRSITARQEESSQRIRGIGQPPPPPVFDSGQGASVQ
ncbi:MAG TPA: DUF4328 domain-containing protein [Blastocatellia bacterium]|nr:DUF4328 domain-containing protein [Blastocatellia bacterium]